MKTLLQWGGICAFIFGTGIYVLLVALQQEEPSPALLSSIDIKNKERALSSELTGSKKQEKPANYAKNTRRLSPVSDRWKETVIKVKRGDSMAAIFSRSDLSAHLLDKMMRSGEDAQHLTHLMPGDDIRLYRDEKQKTAHLLQYDIDQFTTLEIRRQTDGEYQAKSTHHPIEKKIKTAQGIIKDSFFQATEAVNIPVKVAYRMSDIFGWDIDFMRDLRNNDTFFVVYEELYKYGKKVAVGDVIVTAFENNGILHRAVRYTDKKDRIDYYDAEGRTLRKSFLRTPVEYKRISSYFSLKRKHPVLNRIRAHKGVDYAAPRGTPVNATGDGVIQFSGRDGGYGRVIRIQHGQTYTTVYAHLARYHKRVKKGRSVKQGDTIGYVGSSGLATGPHLHYEFRVNGVHRNPLKVKFPKTEPVAKEEYPHFLQKTSPLLARIEQWQSEKKGADTVVAHVPKRPNE